MLQQTGARANIEVVVLTRPIIERLIVAVTLTIAWLHLEFAVPDSAGDPGSASLLIDALIGLARGREQAGLQIALSLAAFCAPAATRIAGFLAGV